MFVLIVASDELSARAVAVALGTSCDATALCAGGVSSASAHHAREATQYDAVLLIASEAANTAPSDCGALRQIWSHCPILALCEMATERDIVACLDAGASDVVALPYRAAELRARLRAQIRAFANSAEQVFQIGPYRFDPSARCLQQLSTGEAVRLTHKETEVLKFLLRAEGSTVSRQRLLREVWGYKDGADSYTVESHIYRLRRKLEADPARPRFILSEEGGYCLVAAPPRPWPPIRVVEPVPLAG